MSEQGQAVHDGHMQVEHDHIEVVPRQPIHGFGAVARADHGPLGGRSLEHASHRSQQRGLIVNDEQAGWMRLDWIHALAVHRTSNSVDPLTLSTVDRRAGDWARRQALITPPPAMIRGFAALCLSDFSDLSLFLPKLQCGYTDCAA